MVELNGFRLYDTLVMEDLSGGKEYFKIRVVNQHNPTVPNPFIYINGMQFDQDDFPDQKVDDSKCVPTSARFQVFNTGPERGWGVQALQDIEPGKTLFEYAGVVSKVRDGQQVDNDDYILGFFHHDQCYKVDAFEKGNLARFVNHSCQPNCHASIDFLPTDDGILPRVIISSLRQIRQGEELLMDYGPQWWATKAGQFFCNCQSELCRYGKGSVLVELEGGAFAQKVAMKGAENSFVAYKFAAKAAKKWDDMPVAVVMPTRNAAGRNMAMKACVESNNRPRQYAMKCVAMKACEILIPAGRARQFAMKWAANRPAAGTRKMTAMKKCESGKMGSAGPTKMTAMKRCVREGRQI